jgi:alkylation response protein AidB-like acyl-CoA dehydrogenase
MLSNITMSLGVVVRVAQMQDAGVEKDEHAALAQATVSSRMRETVGIAREVMGGNENLLEHGLVRFFADAEGLRRRRGRLLLRGRARGQPADRRTGQHRDGRLRLSRLLRAAPVRGR